ncbi:MAG: hypothetical protein ACP5L4_06170, partial [Thermoplasmata archaeon]
MGNVLQKYSDLHEIREVLKAMDSILFNKRDKENNSNNIFEKFLESNNIKHIISMIKKSTNEWKGGEIFSSL